MYDIEKSIIKNFNDVFNNLASKYNYYYWKKIKENKYELSIDFPGYSSTDIKIIEKGDTVKIYANNDTRGEINLIISLPESIKKHIIIAEFNLCVLKLTLTFDDIYKEKEILII